VQGALPFIERTFRVATALTLLEYRDANRPLLQRLAHEAPGTYNHSLVLGTMAESACKAIGADGLLAHVGALYHDIGKIQKAEYFAENQEASINRHDRLAPTMSLLIILGHVKDGLEMAREYGLPRVLYPFIAEHHGTTVVRYFHHVASEKQPQIASGKHDRAVAEAEFRYPGPKPQSKETAVLMLCDGVEGAVRALPDPTAGRIEAIVNQVLQARLKDGQFDECDITLRELHRVEESVVKSLCTFYHGRVAYPKESKETSRSGSTTDAAARSTTSAESKQLAS
jgi:putative nucleotidyltransferase with HDIG domain